MHKKNDTIFALSTPLGKSAIAVIRVSGPNCYKIINKLSTNMPKKPNLSVLNNLVLGKNKSIDQTITTFFKAPKSFTGEDVVEISIHGSSAVIKKTLSTLGGFKNTRIAEPGEFTRRAFENNKLDLTQVEAIADLVNSETEAQRKQAVRQLDGELSKKINGLSNKMKKLLADVEASIDFSEDELPDNLILIIKEQIENIINDINTYIREGDVGEKIRSGFIITVIGKPNTGKSSFINKVAKREVSIVTNEPGTTRDLLELFVDFRGVPIKFYDTAGLRPHKNEAEMIGIQKAYNASNLADINLVFIDDKKETKEYDNINDKIFVKSKSDIIKSRKSNKFFNISSFTGDGFDKLFKEIYSKICSKNIEEDINVSRERHQIALINALKYLKYSKNKKNYDIFAEDIRLAMKEISKITGNIDIEDILEIIFNDFCIGK